MRRLVLLLGLLTAALAGAEEPSGPQLDMELDRESAVVGQPITLRVRVLVPTWMPKPPEFPTFEATNVAVRLPEGASRPTTQRIGGETWSGVARAYRISPMAVGRYRFPPQRVTVTYADPETRAPKTVQLQSDEVAFEGVMPEAASGLDPFIAAEDITLEQRFEGEPESLEPGDAFTRIVTARVQGTSPIFLPPLVAPLGLEGLSAYPKEPVLSEKAQRGELLGERLEHVTYVAEAPGRHRVPPIRLRWYDLDSGAVQETELAGFEIVSRGPLPGPLATFEWQTVGSVSLLLAVLAVLARLLYARFGPLVAAWRERRREVYRASEAHAFAEVAAALRRHDFGAATGAVAIWSTRLPLPSSEHSARIGQAMAPLGRAHYGPSPESPSASAWSGALLALRVLRDEALAASKPSARGLPPLNPGLRPDPGRSPDLEFPL